MLGPATAASGGDSSYPKGRRCSTQLPPSPYKNVHRRLPHLFGGHVPGVSTDAEDAFSDDAEPDEDIEAQENFQGRVQSYSKLMHAHTQAQLSSPRMSTLPSYSRTMHAFTLNQLSHHHKLATKSATNSPQLGVGARLVMLPRQVCTDLSKLSLGEVPNPSNTPEHGHRRAERQWATKRSLTERIPRDFAVNVARKDFAVA